MAAYPETTDSILGMSFVRATKYGRSGYRFRCKCPLTAITASVGSSSSNAASPDSKAKEEVKPDQNKGGIDQPGEMPYTLLF